jgi:hypothetical protein
LLLDDVLALVDDVELAALEDADAADLGGWTG